MTPRAPVGAKKRAKDYYLHGTMVLYDQGFLALSSGATRGSVAVCACAYKAREIQDRSYWWSGAETWKENIAGKFIKREMRLMDGCS